MTGAIFFSKFPPNFGVNLITRKYRSNIQTDTHADRQTDRQTDRSSFYIDRLEKVPVLRTGKFSRGKVSPVDGVSRGKIIPVTFEQVNN